MTDSKKFTFIPKEVLDMPKCLKNMGFERQNVRNKVRMQKRAWKPIPFSVLSGWDAMPAGCRYIGRTGLEEVVVVTK